MLLREIIYQREREMLSPYEMLCEQTRGRMVPISESDINHIWDRFYKSDKSRTNKISTGLGLPIVRLILSQHNQDIWVEKVEDKGVRFIFTLQRNN